MEDLPLPRTRIHVTGLLDSDFIASLEQTYTFDDQNRFRLTKDVTVLEKRTIEEFRYYLCTCPTDRLFPYIDSDR